MDEVMEQLNTVSDRVHISEIEVIEDEDLKGSMCVTLIDGREVFIHQAGDPGLYSLHVWEARRGDWAIAASSFRQYRRSLAVKEIGGALVILLREATENPMTAKEFADLMGLPWYARPAHWVRSHI